MSRNPRDELAAMDEAKISVAIAPLGWPLIRDRCAHMDHCATGGISADATLILSLVLSLVEANAGRGM